MARACMAAGFAKANMPIAHQVNFPQAHGGLPDQDALDVAEFFTRPPRADFPPKVNGGPNGDKPLRLPLLKPRLGAASPKKV